MSTSLGNLFIPIKAVTDTFRSDVVKAAGDAGDSGGAALASGFDKHIQGIGKKAALALGGVFATSKVVEFFSDAISKASALNETIGKSAVVFGQNAAAVQAWSDTTARGIGLSKQAALESAASFGNLFKTMGLGGAATQKMSQNVVGLASDLASFNNLDTADVLDKIRSGLVGEAEPLRALGVQINEAAVKAKALELGLVGANGELSESAKVQARYALILEQTKTAQGDFARTSDGLANQQRINSALFDDATAKLGEKLIPIVTQLAHFAGDTLVPALGLIADNLSTIVTVAEPLALVFGAKVAVSFAESAASALGFTGAATAAGAAAATAGAEAEAGAGGITAFGTALKGIPLLLVAAGIVEIIAKVQSLASNLDLFVGNDVTKTQAAMRSLTDQFGVNAESGGILGDAYKRLQQHLVDLGVATGEESAATKQMSQTLNDHGDRVANNTAATKDNTDAAVDQRGAVAAAAAAMKAAGLHAGALAGTTSRATQEFINNRLAANETGAGLDNVQAAAIAAAGGFDTAATSADTASDSAIYLGQVLDSLPTTTTVNVDLIVKTLTDAAAGAGAGATESDGAPGGGVQAVATPDPFSGHPLGWTPPKRTRHTGGGGGGKSQATKDAEAFAKTMHDKVVAAYEEAQKAGDAWYASIHDSKTKAVDDAHDLRRERIDSEHDAANAAIEDAHRVAKEQFDAERQSISDRLTERKKLNAAPVTAAEKALADVQTARRLRDLQEQFASAEQGVDPKALRSAQEALSDFMAQQNIDLLRQQQAVADDQAEAEAKAAGDELDTRIKAEDALHEKQVAEEDARYKARTDAEDKRYKLAQHDEDVRSQRQIAKFDEHIAAMDDSKKATVALAQAETKRFLQEQLKLAKESGTAQDVRFAQADLDVFLKSLPHKAAGGWVGMKGPELVIEGEDGPEYVVPRASGNSVMQFARGAASAASGQTTNIEVTINNPSPEPASRSAERPLRQIAAGLFG